MQARKYWIVTGIALLVLVAISFLLVRPGLHKWVETNLQRLAEEGTTIGYDHFNIHLLKKGISFHDVDIVTKEGSQLTSEIVELTNLGLYGIFFRDRIRFRNVYLLNPVVTLQQKGEPPADTTMVLPEILIDHIQIQSGVLVRYDSSGTDTVTVSLNQLKAVDFSIHGDVKTSTLQTLEVRDVTLTTSLYAFTADHMLFDNEGKTFHSDTLRVQPRYSRENFSIRQPVESDQLTVTFLELSGAGVHVELAQEMPLSIQHVETRFSLHSFKDKRLPDRTAYKPLPVELFNRLSWKFNVDTITLVDSEVSYEEFGEEADSTATILFDHLQARVLSLTNDSLLPAPSFKASSRLMKDGEIQIEGHLTNGAKPFYLEGTLRNFQIGILNNMLAPPTGIRIEAGSIDQLRFNFWYNNDRSDGQVELSYKDLKIAVLKERNNALVKNEVVTFLLNMFIQKDDGRLVTGENNPGIVLYRREKTKGIFDFWWKSVLSGIKSSFLDDRKLLSKQVEEYEKL